MMGTVLTIAREEGAGALWKGLEPGMMDAARHTADHTCRTGLHRQFLYGGLRIGLYEPVKRAIAGDQYLGDAPLHIKIVSGLATGALAISVASPTDLVKVRRFDLQTDRLYSTTLHQVRMQAEGKLPAGTPRQYPSAFKAYGIIAKKEGIAGLWTGLGPNVARNAIINAAELASYDQVRWHG